MYILSCIFFIFFLWKGDCHFKKFTNLFLVSRNKNCSLERKKIDIHICLLHNFLIIKLVFLTIWCVDKFDRVPCIRSGGLRFSFQGNGYWLLVYVMNVGGGGDIANIWVKGSRTGWISMSHNWGASYQAFATLGGQALSFKIASYTTKETIIAWNVAPSNWGVGLTYSTNVNFH